MESIKKIVQAALVEDIGDGDVTTKAIVPTDVIMDGRFIAKAPGIIAGLDVVQTTFCLLDERIQFMPQVKDGAPVEAGQIIATITGPGHTLLAGERVALNFLQRMSGIATLTHRFVQAVAGTQATILDTRKTVPGLRLLDKLAVQAGGGQNHRFGLYDMALIKENHIAAAGGDATQAVTLVRARHPHLPLEIEVTTLSQLEVALTLPVDRIMLDNMSQEEMQEAVHMVNGRIPLEASGNVTLETVKAIAETGVDYISIGALTHSVEALDISLLLEYKGSFVNKFGVRETRD